MALKWKQVFRGSVFAGLLCIVQGFALEEKSICPHFVLRGEATVGLSDTEKRLICGDPKNPAWDKIPTNQAMFHLRAFLQERGYFRPQLLSERGQSVVDIGPRTYVGSIHLEGAPEVLHITEMRHIVGELLTPKFLDSVARRIGGRLQNRGYPCPKVETKADPVSGRLEVSVNPGPLQKFASIREEAVPDLNEKVLRRYDAFRVGDPYNEASLVLTANRIVNDGILQSTHFTALCGRDGAEVRQNVVAGPPRQFTIGIGVSTDELLNGRIRWKNLRLGPSGSNVEVYGRASFRRQELGVLGNWYYLNRPSRHFLLPSLTLTHRLAGRGDDFTDALEGRARLAPGITWDNHEVGLSAVFGPQYQWVLNRTLVNQSVSHLLSLNGEVRLQSHEFELFQTRPQTGYLTVLEVNFAQQGWLSTVTAQHGRLSFQKLWNLFSYDPPWNVLGVRGSVGTTFTGLGYDTSNARAQNLQYRDQMEALPASYRHLMGGGDNLRGFVIEEIAGVTGRGGLTSAYLGIEDRFSDLLPWGLQPFVFFDLGMLGTESFQLDPVLYWNPGVGLRWETTLGVFRATLAHGFVSGDLSRFPVATGSNKDHTPDRGEIQKASHLTFFFSYGQEF